MGKVSQQPFDYFIASGERAHDSVVLRQALHVAGKEHEDFVPRGAGDKAHPRVNKFREPLSYERMKEQAIPMGLTWEATNIRYSEPIGGTRHASVKAVLRKLFWWRVSAAVVGGAFLVGPMWLLVLERDLLLNLGVATGFVFAFGLLMVGFVEQTDQVFASTLAYAAVLMVFVGVMMDKQFVNARVEFQFPKSCFDAQLPLKTNLVAMKIPNNTSPKTTIYHP